MRKVIIFVALAFLLVLCATPAQANGIPPLPHAFYGNVTINESPAPAGTQVEARGEGVLRIVGLNPIVTTEVGKYGSANPAGAKLIVQGNIVDGATITFYVKGVSTGQTALWHSGETTKLDLAVTIPVPPGAGGGGFGPGDTEPPGISDISASNITETTADISWETDEKSTSQVEYWSSPSKLSPLDETRVIHHLVHLTGLTPCTTYYYRTMSGDAAGNLAVSDKHSFTTLGKAAFSSSDLSISPGEVNIGETVTISALVANTGSCPGSYTVTLKINGVVEATEEVTLNPGASEEVSFTTAKDVPGSYSVDVNGLIGSFTVKEKPVAPPTPPVVPPEVKPPIKWPLIGGIIAAVIVVGLLVFFLVRRRVY